MKKVKAIVILLAIQLVMSLERMFRTVRSSKVVNGIDDERNTTPMLAFKDQFLKSKVFKPFKLVRFANKRNGQKVFVLMSTWNPIVKASVNPPDDAEGKAKLAEKIQTAAAKTGYITIDPLLYGTVLTALIKAMRDAVGANQVIKAWNDLNKQLKKIMALVQAAMDEDITDSAAIICEYYEFHVIGKGGSHEQVLSGEPGTAAGEIDLLFPVLKGCSYTAKLYSADRTTFVYALGTDVAHQTIGGLVSGSMQAVSVIRVLHGVVQEESQIIEVRVK